MVVSVTPGPFFQNFDTELWVLLDHDLGLDLELDHEQDLELDNILHRAWDNMNISVLLCRHLKILDQNVESWKQETGHWSFIFYKQDN